MQPLLPYTKRLVLKHFNRLPKEPPHIVTGLKSEIDLNREELIVFWHAVDAEIAKLTGGQIQEALGVLGVELDQDGVEIKPEPKLEQDQEAEVVVKRGPKLKR